ncbi:MAG: hypothetical protein NXI03_12275, partial [Alphaproteobacteria bacterium]|nr:hypothetical protein [Alphaproteobacteria bacterium]
MKTNLMRGAASVAMAMAVWGAPALADDEAERIEALESRIEQLEETNRLLLEYLAAQGVNVDGESGEAAPAPHHGPHHDQMAQHHAPHHEQMAQHHGAPAQAPMADHHADMVSRISDGLVGISPEYSYRMLDHAEGVNTRQLIQLQAIQNGELPNRVTLSGGITVLGNMQRSNSDTKFGWLMRHPTSSNQIGEDVSELVVHNAQLAFTARMSDWITAYAEILYDPEQSFGSGTITALTRNQLQLRKGYVLFGNLDESPIYAAVGKMDVPFGLQDTVSPFTNSTSWHAFAPLAYGGMVGYYNGNFHLRGMAVQGGAQFRSANSPVQDTEVPSRVNNFAIDANYTMPLGQGEDSVM